MKLLSATAALLTALLFPTGASAVYIEFSGETGTRGSITITEPVTFTITSANTWQLHLVIKDAFEAVPASGGWMGMDFDHNLTFSINNTGNTTGYSYNATFGFASNDVGSKDIKIHNSASSAPYSYQYNIGDVFTLNPGTYATNYTGLNYVVPSNGNYTMFLVDSGDNRASENGVTAVPEPSTWAFLGAGAVGFATMLRRRKLANAA